MLYRYFAHTGRLLAPALLTTGLGLLTGPAALAQTGIGTATPDASAALEISSGTRGLLVPRLSLTSTTAAAPLTLPATSLLVFNTNAALPGGRGYYYNAGTPASPQWVQLLTTTSPTGGDFWRTVGNAGTSAGAQFLGTTDAQDLVFKTNGTERLRIRQLDGALWTAMPNGNVALGPNTGAALTSGSSNTFVGTRAGQANSAGSFNTFLGTDAGKLSTATGNTLLGSLAGSITTTGANNTFVGLGAGNANTSGARNVAVGFGAGEGNTTGERNVVVGQAAGLANATGSHNTFLGDEADAAGPALDYATAIGAGAIVGASNSLVLGGTGPAAVNVGIGTATPQARLHVVGGGVRLGVLAGTGVRLVTANAVGDLGASLSTGPANGLFWGLSGNAATDPATEFIGTTDARDLVFRTNATERMRLRLDGGLHLLAPGGNTFVGDNAGLNLNATAINNVYVGTQAGQNNANGLSNVAVGYAAGTSSTATHTTMVGFAAGFNSGGTSGVFVGEGAGYTATGSGNTLVGFGAGFGVTTGTDNTISGRGSGYELAGGSNNTLYGAGSGAELTGDDNTALGQAAGANLTTANDNVLVGRQAGNALVGGDRNTLVGSGADASGPNLTNATALGAGALVGQSNALVLGAFADVGIGTSTPAARLHVAGGGVRLGALAGTGVRLVTTNANGDLGTTAAPLNALVWGLNGNAGTNPATNFLGTTDNKDVVFRADNIERLRIKQTNGALWTGMLLGNVALGNGTGAALGPTASHNTLIGDDAGAALDNSGDNTLVGYQAGAVLAGGSDNTIVGAGAGAVQTFGTFVTLVGAGAGANNVVGSSTFIGANAGKSNTNGFGNTFVGIAAGEDNLTGAFNTYLGQSAGGNSSGDDNTFLGAAAGLDNDGNRNVFVGNDAGASGATGDDNTFVGEAAGKVNTATGGTFVGQGAGAANTAGIGNTFVGEDAGDSNTTGDDNVMIGRNAGHSNITGNNNVTIGSNAGDGIITGADNVLIGHNADVTNSLLTNAIAIGANAVVTLSNSMVLGGTGANAVNVGIGMTTPVTALDVLGALALRDDGTVTDIIADNQLITVGNRGFIRLSSDALSASTRTITLSNGGIRGQLLIIQSADTGSSDFEVADNAILNNTNTPVSRALGAGDVIQLIWNGTSWCEMSFTDN